MSSGMGLTLPFLSNDRGIMAGIYIHIPFCRRACHYCNFHFSTSLKLKNAFLEALLKEISIRKDYLSGETVNTVYFGGGTPSLLEQAELVTIMDALRHEFEIGSGAEVTLEANPDDISPAKLNEWKEAGINRLSIGVQSFFDSDLVWMNRAHSASQAYNALSDAIHSGFRNISIDLIYGTPGLTDSRWEKNLLTAVNLHIPHLSCYALTVEPGTALDLMTRRKKASPVNSDDQARQFMIMSTFLERHGYEHYEISNLALPGKRSVHNSAYWSGEKYLGLGASAHSFNGTSRQWNVANNALYIKALQNGSVPYEIETLTPVQKLNEYLMTSIRTMEGLDMAHMKKTYGEGYAEKISAQAGKFRERGWLVDSPDRLALTKEGKLFADGIASELFIVE